MIRTSKVGSYNRIWEDNNRTREEDGRTIILSFAGYPTGAFFLPPSNLFFHVCTIEKM